MLWERERKHLLDPHQEAITGGGGLPWTPWRGTEVAPGPPCHNPNQAEKGGGFTSDSRPVLSFGLHKGQLVVAIVRCTPCPYVVQLYAACIKLPSPIFPTSNLTHSHPERWAGLRGIGPRSLSWFSGGSVRPRNWPGLTPTSQAPPSTRQGGQGIKQGCVS